MRSYYICIAFRGKNILYIIREKRGYIYVHEYNSIIDLWTPPHQNTQGVGDLGGKKTYIMCMMCLYEFNFIFAFLR